MRCPERLRRGFLLPQVGAVKLPEGNLSHVLVLGRVANEDFPFGRDVFSQ